VIIHNGSFAWWDVGDCREALVRWAASGTRARMCVTSPPYFNQRHYNGGESELGRERTPQEYVRNLVDVMRLVRDVLTKDGTLWLNLGDGWAQSGGKGEHPAMTSARRGRANVKAQAKLSTQSVPPGFKQKDLFGIPWRVAFALQDDGWYLRSDIIWAKGTSGMIRGGGTTPESVRDRPCKAHEYVFLLAKSRHYYFDYEAIQEPAKDWGKPRDRSNMRGGTTDPLLKHAGLSKVDHEMGNMRDVWRINTSRYQSAHFATFPPALVEPCIRAGSAPGDIVIDPFGGSGTTGGVALREGRHALLCELNPDYAKLMPDRIRSICA